MAQANGNGPTAPAAVTLVTGTDEYEASRQCRALIDRLCPPEQQTLSLETIDAACDTVDESIRAVRTCLDAVQTMGFFGADKVVWLRDASFFYDSRPGKSPDVKSEVARLTEEIKRGLVPGVKLVISAAQVDKRGAFYKAIDKLGSVMAFQLPDKDYKWDDHAAGVLRGMLQEAGLKASGPVIEEIIERAGNHSRQLHMEVEKLAVYMGDRTTVTREDVADIISPARERGFGELLNAFSQRRLAECLRMVRQLLYQKESAVGLIISLENRVRDLRLYRTALANRWARQTGSGDWPQLTWVGSPEADAFFSALPNDPRKANPFWAGKLAAWAGAFPRGELPRIQRVLVEEHGRITEGVAEDEVLLEWALIRALGGEARRGDRVA